MATKDSVRDFEGFAEVSKDHGRSGVGRAEGPNR